MRAVVQNRASSISRPSRKEPIAPPPRHAHRIHVRDAEARGGRAHADDFVEGAVFAVEMMKGEVRRDVVEGPVGERHRLGATDDERRVRELRPSEREHPLRRIDARPRHALAERGLLLHEVVPSAAAEVERADGRRPIADEGLEVSVHVDPMTDDVLVEARGDALVVGAADLRLGHVSSSTDFKWLELDERTPRPQGASWTSPRS